MKKLLSLLALGVVLTGCGGSDSSAKKSTCTGEMPGVTDDATIIFESADGKKIDTMEMSLGMNYEDYGLTKEMADAGLDAVREQYNGVEGMESTVEAEEDQYKITVKFDFAKINESELDSLAPNLSVIAQVGEADYTEAVESMESGGLTCK